LKPENGGILPKDAEQKTKVLELKIKVFRLKTKVFEAESVVFVTKEPFAGHFSAPMRCFY
jgi:hypothetical protein